MWILNYLYFYSSLFRISSDSDDFFLFIEGDLISDRSKMAFFARLANCKVENVSAEAVAEGLIQIMNLIFPCPRRESLRILVNFEFRKGICVLDFSINAEMQWPNDDKLPFILVNSWILISFSAVDKSEGILNFSEPAKSTILKVESTSWSCYYFSILIWKMEWDLELLALAWVEPVALFYLMKERLLLIQSWETKWLLAFWWLVR